MSWSSCDDRERLSLDYPRICVHAISRDVSSFPSACVYLLYSASPPDSASSGSDDEGEVPDVDELPPTEVRVVPPNSDQRMYSRTSCNIHNYYDCASPSLFLLVHALYIVETIYSAICECQLLYPDPEQSDSSCEDEIVGAEWTEGGGENVQHIQQCPADFFTSADGLEHLTAEGAAVLAHLESILQVQAQQDSENGNDLASLYMCYHCDYGISRLAGDAENGQFEDADVTDNKQQ